MRFKLLYIIFIVICILYPSKYIVGPISIRHIISLIMLASCLLEGFRADKYLYLYCGFLLFLGISSVATGFGGTFFNKLFGTYLPFVAAYASTFLLIKKFEGTNLLVGTIVCIGVLNAIVTIGQFFDLSLAEKISSILHVEIDEKYVTLLDFKEESEGLALPGLLGTVDNGYFLSATALLTLYNKNCRFSINVCLWMIVITASFLAQERAGFLIAIVFSALIVRRNLLSKNKTVGYFVLIAFLLIGALAIYSYLDDILSSDLRYSKGFEGDGRSEYRIVSWSYLFQNPMGGFYYFDALGHHHPHNFFVNAFLYGGFWGGICLIVLFVLQIVRITPYLFRTNDSKMFQWAFIWGIMYIDYSLNSMVHNASIVQGILPFFVWWGAFLASDELYEEDELILDEKIDG